MTTNERHSLMVSKLGLRTVNSFSSIYIDISQCHKSLSGTDCFHCESFSLASLRSRIAFFSESDSGPRDLWGKSSGAEDCSCRWQASSRRLNAHVPRHHCRESISLSSSPNTISVPPRLWATWSRSVWATTNWMTAFSWRLQTRKSYRALWLTPPSCRHLLNATPDSEQMKSSSALWQRLSTSSGSNGLRLRSHLAAGWKSGFFQGAIRLSANASFLKCTMSSRNHDAPPTRLASALLLQVLSNPLMVLQIKYMSTYLLWMNMWPHISARPQLSDGRRGRATRPSRAEPHLHSHRLARHRRGLVHFFHLTRTNHVQL